LAAFHKFGRLVQVLRPRLALDVDQREVIARNRMISGGGKFEEIGSLLLVLLDAAPFGQHHAERKLAMHLAERGALRIIFRGLGHIQRNAEALLVHLPQQRMRGTVALVSRLFGQLPGLSIFAGIERVVDRIGRQGRLDGRLGLRRFHVGNSRRLASRRQRRPRPQSHAHYDQQS
jgi:hypothetical protein